MIAGLGINAHGRFIHDNQLGLVGDGTGDVQPPFHTSREAFGEPLLVVGKSHELQSFKGIFVKLLSLDTVESGKEADIFVGREIVVYGNILRDNAYLGFGKVLML